MSSIDRRQVEQLFQDVLDASPEKRSSILRASCAGDPKLRQEVERLVLAHDAAHETFLEDPAIVTGGTTLSASHQQAAGLSIPHRVGPYDIIRVLGEGGMGMVYEARQQSPNRTVALKVIRPGQDTQGMVKRFQREADVLGHLHHPGIACIYEAGSGRVEGAGWSITQPYIAMELIRGEPLNKYCESRRLSMRDRLELLARVADGVQHAHEHGVVHRDLKPSNILVDEAGQPKILDFGVARLIQSEIQSVTVQTDAGQIIGTLDYMSPEQVGGDLLALDARTDVYSLGVILYELLSGRLPHNLRGCPVPEAVRIIREEEPSRLSSSSVGVSREGVPSGRFDRDIETIVSKAIEKDRSRRYASAADLAADLRRHLGDEPIVARPSSTFYQLRKFAKRNRVLVGGIVATFVALVGGLVGVAIVAQRATVQRENAERERARAERQAYRTSIAAALAAVQNADGQTALRYLDEAPEGLRQWEWSLARRMADPSVRELSVPWDGSWHIAIQGDHTVAWRINASEKQIELGSLDPPRRFPSIAVEDPENVALVPLFDGKRLIVGHLRDRRVELRELETGRTLWTLPEVFPKWGCGVDRASKLLALSTDFDRSVQIIDLDTGAVIHTLEAISEVPPPTFSHDSSMVAVGDRVYALDQPRELWRTNGQFQCFSPDNQRAVVIRQRESSLYAVVVDSRSGAPQGEFPISDSYTWVSPGVLFRQDGEAIFELNTYSRLQLRDASTLEVLSDAIARQDKGAALTAGALSICDGGRSVAVTRGPDQRIRLYDAENLGVAWSYPVWDSASYSAHLSPDGRLLARSDWGSITLVEARTGRVMWRRANGISHNRAVRISPDQSRIAVDEGLGRIAIRDIGDGRILRELPPVPGHSQTLLLRWVNNECLAAAFDNGGVVVWPLSTTPSSPTCYEHLSSSVTALAVDPKGTWLLAGSDGSGPLNAAGTATRLATSSPSFSVFDFAASHARTIRDVPGGAFAAAVSRDGSTAIIGVLGGVDVWDTRTWTKTASLRGPLTPVRALGWDSDEHRVWGASDDGKLFLWAYPIIDTQEIASWSVPDAPLLDLAFTPDGAGLVLAARRQTINWDLQHADPDLIRERTRWSRASSVVRSALVGAVRVGDVEQRVRARERLSTADQDSAIRLANAIGMYAPRHNSAAWGTIVVPGRPLPEYERALDLAQAAVDAVPDDWAILNTLGLAQYRSQRYAECIRTLHHADERSLAVTGTRRCVNWAILAMAHHELAQDSEAETCFRRAQELSTQEKDSSRDSSMMIVREASERLAKPAHAD